MRTLDLICLILMSVPAKAANMAGPSGAAPRPVPALSVPVAPFPAASDRLDAVLDAVSLRGYKQLPAQIDKLNAAYAAQGLPEHRLVLAALAQPRQQIVGSLQASGVRAATARRAGALAAKAQQVSRRDPALAAALARSSKLIAASSKREHADPVSARIEALVDSVVSRWRGPAPQAVSPIPPAQKAAAAPASSPGLSASTPAQAAPKPAPPVPQTARSSYLSAAPRAPWNRWTNKWWLIAANAALLAVPAGHVKLGAAGLMAFAVARTFGFSGSEEHRLAKRAAWFTAAWCLFLLIAVSRTLGLDD